MIVSRKLSLLLAQDIVNALVVGTVAYTTGWFLVAFILSHFLEVARLSAATTSQFGKSVRRVDDA